MREINKFRAWDGYRMTTSGIMFNSTTGELVSAGNMPIMQFTGLHDRLGKEIYEGDICSYYDVTSDEFMLNKGKIIGWVNFIPDRCALMLQEIKENHKGGHYIACWDFLQNIEVLDNIYENSERLEAPHDTH